MMMSIDVSSYKTDLFGIVFYLIVILSTTLSGVYGPQHYKKNSFNCNFGHGELYTFEKTLYYGYGSNVETLLTLDFLREEENSKTVFPVAFSYNLTIGTYHKAAKTIIEDIATNIKSPITLYYDKGSSIKQMDLKIKFNNVIGLSGCIINVYISQQSYHKFISRIKLMFTFLCLFTLLSFVFRHKKYPLAKWTFEQKYTVILFLLALIGINPLSFIFDWPILAMIENITSPLFEAMLCFFILSVYDNAINKVYRHDFKFYAPKVVICLLIFIFQALINTVYNSLIELCSFLSRGFYLIYFISMSFSAIRRLDPSEEIKTIVYTIIFMLNIILQCAEVLFSRIELFNNTTGLFAFDYAISYGFVILMAFYHWSYITNSDENYNDIDSSDKSHVDLLDDESPSNEEDK